MKKSLILLTVLFVAFMASSCSGTWQGAKKDTKDNAQWSKDKVNDGAQYIEEKTD